MAIDLLNDVVMPFIRVTADTFDSMLDVRLRVTKVERTNSRHKQKGIFALIGLTGDMQGTISISFPEDVAKRVFSKMLDEEITVIDEGSSDTAGEIINIVAGGKSQVKGANLTMSLPTVMFGNPMLISLPRDVPTVRTTFYAPEIGEFHLFVCLKENR